MPEIKVSAVLSVHNRSRLLRRALDGYLWQTLPADQWEIVLVDDMSDEDLELVYAPFVGRMNLRHVRMDHKRHRIWKERNPSWQAGQPEDWFHTPALSTNLGASVARGGLISLCHPEILHAPTNFEKALERSSREQAFLFGLTYLGTAELNRSLDDAPDWTALGWHGFLGRANANALEHYGHERYWYTSFLPKAAIEKVGGVSFQYLHGVAGEDDDFKHRVRQAGYPDVFAQEIQGLHQDHFLDKDSWTYKRQIDPERFEAALNRNRALLYARLGQPQARFGPIPCGPGFPQPENTGYDWTASECTVWVKERAKA